MTANLMKMNRFFKGKTDNAQGAQEQQAADTGTHATTGSRSVSIWRVSARAVSG
jgi:hypothetical protein